VITKFLANLSNKEKKILYIAVPFVLIALYDRLLVAQALDSLNMLDEKIVIQERTIKADLRFLQYKDRILAENEAYAKFIFTEDIENKDINRNFLSTVENMAAQSNVNIIKSNPTEALVENDYIKYFANVDCAGSLSDMLSFMHNINSTDDLLKVVRFKMTPKRGEESSVNASMTLSKLVVQPSHAKAKDIEEVEEVK